MTNKIFFPYKMKNAQNMWFPHRFSFLTKILELEGVPDLLAPHGLIPGLVLLWFNFLGIFFFSGHFYEYSQCLPVPEMIQLHFGVFSYHLIEEAVFLKNSVFHQKLSLSAKKDPMHQSFQALKPTCTVKKNLGLSNRVSRWTSVA